jgi:dihydrofolate synthase/folylpolyglutamate synthase
MTYEEALEYIHGISWTFCKPGLERIRELCRKLGNPEKKLKFIHVAGTNGKGSFCSMLSSVLTEAGLRVGLYTSPYIVRFNERIQLSGKPIQDEILAELTEKIKPVADGMKDKPTEFELITAIGFMYFKKMGADVVILEAGMGGRLDSTNVIDTPLLSVITGVALDHTAFLGDTVKKIAVEKAGIIKSGVPTLWGGEDTEAEDVITATANKLGSPLYRTHHEKIKVNESSLDGTVFSYGEWDNIKLKLLGLYQPKNCATVLEAVGVLRKAGLSIDDEAVKAGLSKATWPARFEVIDRDPLTIFDGAHNPEGIDAAVKSIRHYFKGQRVFAVTGVLRDKDYGYIAKKLATVIDRAYTITPDNPRALTAEEYKEVLKSEGVDAVATESIKEALHLAREDARLSGANTVCLGSLYTYSEAISALNEK